MLFVPHPGPSPHPVLFGLLALATAIGICGALVYIYNRTLYNLHESKLKKASALGLLPLGVFAGTWLAWLGFVRDHSWALVLALPCIVAAPVLIYQYAVVWCEKHRLHGASRFRRVPDVRDPVAWKRIKPFGRVVLRALAPFNGVGELRIHQRRVVVPGLDPAFDGYRVVHLTDFHIHPTLTATWYRRVVAEANALRPDVILFGGDFISKRPHIRRIAPVMRHLSAPDGVWFVRGNHDFWTEPGTILLEARRAGMRHLGNSAVRIRRGGGELELIGIEEPYVEAPTGAFGKQAECPRLALVHTPDVYARAAQLGAFAALAGHTHGGQIRLPLFGTTISGTSAGPGLASGVGRAGHTLTITSNGQGAFFPLRILCPPEIVVLVLESGPSIH